MLRCRRVALPEQTIQTERERFRARARARARIHNLDTSPQELGSNEEWDRCEQDCAHFVDTHVKIDEPQARDSKVIPFKLWPDQPARADLPPILSQRGALARMVAERLLVILKARQLGISWLCCAYALWICIFKPGSLVLLFSMGAREAYELARRIKVMYERLPQWVRDQCPLEQQSLHKLVWKNGSTIRSLAATKSAGRSFTATLVLMDEAAFMANGEELYNALKPTIDGGGQLFVVSTANGETGFFYKLWKDAEKGINNFRTLFLSWRARPDRTDAWRLRVAQEAISSVHDLQEYPNTADEAFQATSVDRFLQSMLWWKACGPTPENPKPIPDLTRNDPMVIALDAGGTGTDPETMADSFGMIACSIHPTDSNLIAVQFEREWRPPKKGKPLDYDLIESEISAFCNQWNVLCLVYDPSQMHQMATRLANVVLTEKFNQGGDRLAADKNLLDLIVQRRIVHRGEGGEDGALYRHLNNANAKPSQDGRKLRIVKRKESLKIDLAVSCSMAAYKIGLLYANRARVA